MYIKISRLANFGFNIFFTILEIPIRKNNTVLVSIPNRKNFKYKKL